MLAPSTPFAKWRENGEPDPHGTHYSGESTSLCMANVSSEMLAEDLVTVNKGLLFIGVLTAGKERLRWLSRKLYRLADDHDAINAHRATMPKGQYSDDEMANAFYLTESPEDLRAGAARIVWLVRMIKECEARTVNFKVTSEGQGHMFVEISAETDARIPQELKTPWVGELGDYSLCMNEVECAVLGADMDNLDHCADWYVVTVC